MDCNLCKLCRGREKPTTINSSEARQSVAYTPYMGLYMELGNSQRCCFRGTSVRELCNKSLLLAVVTMVTCTDTDINRNSR